MHFPKRISIIISLCLLLGCLSVIDCQQAKASTTALLYLNPTSYTAKAVGEVVPFQGRLSQAVNFTGYVFALTFNSTMLKCINATAGKLPTTTAVVVINNNAGTITVQSSAGDINHDGKVDLVDLVYLANAYGTTPASGGVPGAPHAWNPNADVNGDGKVGLTDLVYLAEDYERINAPNPTGSEAMVSVNFNATFGAPYMKSASCPIQIVNTTVYGPLLSIIPSTSQNATYYSPYVAPKQLNMTLFTDKTSYLFNQNISINGTLTGDGIPISDALVPLEIVDPNGNVAVLRALTTASFEVPEPLQLGVTPCTVDGIPNNNFTTGDFAYFNVTINNSGAPIQNAEVWVNPYDSSNATLGAVPFTTNVNSGFSSVKISVPLDYNDTIGTAKVYANVLTGLVQAGGVPRALEAQATFNIAGNVTGTPVNMTQPPTGTFKTILKIHWGQATAGTYTIYAATNYMGDYTIISKTIQVTS